MNTEAEDFELEEDPDSQEEYRQSLFDADMDFLLT